jgi:16S rRNA (guanine527-N7)-methyltransferase
VTLPQADRAVQAVPDAATAVFGSRIELARRYAALLCGEGVVQGLIGPREPARIWSRHLLNSAALAPFIPAGAAVVDLGSGAGLPGIPLVLVRPDLRMTLLEPLARRIRFLDYVREQLGLDLALVRARAEEITPGADVVVARAVAPLSRLLDLAVPLLRPGGMLLAHKGAQVTAELAGAAEKLRVLKPAEVTVHALDVDGGVTSVVCVITNPEPLRLRPRGRVVRANTVRGGTGGGRR